MQGSKLRILLGGVLIAVTAPLHAEALQPDPAWQQGKLANGFNWQLLQTPQRPNDRVQLRLLVQTGSMMEKSAEKGFSYLIPKVVMFNSNSLNSDKLQNLWRNAIDPTMPMPPAIVSYDFTIYNLSVPNNNPELLKNALLWMSDVAGRGIFQTETVESALKAPDSMVATFPPDVNLPQWKSRIEGTTLQGFDPAPVPSNSIDVQSLENYYQRWYTPDMMTLYIAGPVDKRSMDESINQAFGQLSGKRQTPAVVASLPPMKPVTIGGTNEKLTQDRLSIIWDLNWSSVKDSNALNDYWLGDLSREVIYNYLQEAFVKKNEGLTMDLDCRVQYQRASCALELSAPNEKMNILVPALATALANLKEKGISQAQFDSFVVMKQNQLQQLFAIYARTSTDILINQRLMSQQSNIIDIPPEQYQRLRQSFLASLTPEMLNKKLKAILDQDSAFIFTQPKGEVEMNVTDLRIAFDKIMHPDKPVAVPAPVKEKSESEATKEPKDDATSSDGESTNATENTNATEGTNSKSQDSKRIDVEGINDESNMISTHAKSAPARTEAPSETQSENTAG